MAKEIRRRNRSREGLPEGLPEGLSQGNSEVLSGVFGVSPLLSRIFSARGIKSPAELDLGLKHLLPPGKLKNIELAADLVVKALVAQKRILIVGDFDADGATSCALMVHGLRSFGAQFADYLVPSRFDFGYGLTPEIVALAHEQKNPDLIVTVDNGISSVEGVLKATELGIETLITDHHLAPETLPQASAIVNPNQPGCEFPSKVLAGVGVAFYLLTVVRQHLDQQGWFEQRVKPTLVDYLDLVALGTIADVVPLDYNNRILVNEGLRRIRVGKSRPGLLAMLRFSRTRIELVTSQDLAFFVGPRLNAAGRLDDMSLGIECLLCDDDFQADELAAGLDALNTERREIEHEMKQQALETLRALPSADLDQSIGIGLFDESWHQGVVGIVASRIKDRFHRPVVAFARVSEKELKGSGRSIPGFHMRDAFAAIDAQNPGLIKKFGGHAMAAGLSLHPDDLKQFNSAFNYEADRLLKADDLAPAVFTDGELVDAHSIPLAREIAMAAPWGQGFQEPVFDDEFEVIEQRIVGGRHLKLKVRPVHSDALIDAIAFGEDSTVEGRFRRMAYRLDVNEYRGLESVQLIIESLGN